MAKESTNLLGDRKTKLSLQKYQQMICFHSKGGLLVLVWILTVLMSTLFIIYSFPKLLITYEEILISNGMISSLYILFQLLGYFGKRHSTYRLLVIGKKLIVAGFFMSFTVMFATYIPGSVNNKTSRLLRFITRIVELIAGLCGHEICFANFIQYGVAQLQFAPSKDHQAFIRWAVLAILITEVAPQMIGGFLRSSDGQLLIASAVFFAFTVAVIALTYFLNNHLTSESSPQFDPVWLIWKTLSFAWKYKFPVRPSACIYWSGFQQF